MKDTIDTRLKTFTDTMDTYLKTITNTMNTLLKTITNTMNTLLKIITAVLIVIVIFFLLATTIIYVLYQRPSPAPDKTYNNHPNSENTPSSTLTNMFRNLATGKGLKVATEGEVATAYVNINGEDCWLPEQCVTCILVSELTGKKTECSAKRTINKTRENRYEISYRATSRGRHQLHIKVEGEHIKGSPFTVIVKLPVQKLGTPIKIISGLKEPRGVAVNQRGEILVAERARYCISIFNSTAQKLGSFGSDGTEQGKFRDVHGVAMDGDGNILVTDCTTHCIYKFSSEHKLLKTVGSRGNKSLQFDGPLSVAVSPITKKIAIPEWDNHRVQILNPDLTFYRSFGSKGSDNGQFICPHDIAFDSTGNIYVTDAWNHRVQVFNPEGIFLRQFGNKGEGDGELNFPAGISIDSDDTVYVTEGRNQRVSVFTYDGKFLASFGNGGSGPGQFNSSYRLTVDRDGIIYVSDSKNNRLQLF